MKKILVPLDLTDISEFGLQLAAHISNHIDVEIIMLNYVNPPTEGGFSSIGDITSEAELAEDHAFLAATVKKNKQNMEELISKYAAHNKAQFKPVLQIGKFENINDYIKTNRIDLVVMGTSGESTFSEFFLGNHTEQVIRVSECPVLSVKQPVEKFEPSEMVMATDLHTGNDIEVNYFRELASWFNSKVHLLHVVKDEKQATIEKENEVDQYAKNHGLTNFASHVLSGDKEEVIKYFVRSHKIGMIGITTRAKGGLNNLFFGSLSEDLVKELDIPVLVLTVNMES